ncbi:MAG: hypothetical protein ABEH61_03450 [Haloarculaceae archaeon]
MSSGDKFEKVNTDANTRLLKLYLGSVGLLIGLLTMYQSTTGTDAPFWGGVVVTLGSAIYLGRHLRKAIGGRT